MLTIFRILLALAAVTGVGLGSFYMVRAIEDTSPEQEVVASPTATLTPLPTNTPEPTATAVPPQPTVALPSPTAQAAPTMIPTTPTPLSLGERVFGGREFEFGQLLFFLPDAGEFEIASGVGDPGGPFILVLHLPTRSSLWLDPYDGHEIARRVLDPVANAIFDAIVSSLRVVSK